MSQATETEARGVPTITLVFGVIGLIVTGAIVMAAERYDPSVFRADYRDFVLWTTLSFLVGFVLRTARRQAVFAGHLSLHKAGSFEALFQGATLIHPQLPYPRVEREFHALHAGLLPEQLSPWFSIRLTSGVAIPLVLGGVAVALAGAWPLAALLWAASFGWTGYRSVTNAPAGGVRWRVFAATLLGMAASVGEGLLFLNAAEAVTPGSATWETFVLYAVLLTAYELSPVPLALGVLEAAYLVMEAAFGWALPGLILPLAYRLWRGVPILLLMLFYLPRYKMTVRDLYSPGLADILAGYRRRRQAPGIEAHEGTPRLTVVLPAYNEAERLPKYLPTVVEFCEQLEGGAELLVVDDGSSDGTVEYVNEVSQGHSMLRLVVHERNQGKGAAVRTGVMEARGQYVLFADADGATPIKEVWKLLAAARNGADVVIGSRKAASDDVRRERSFLRESIGSVFYRVTNLVALPSIADTQCGFKLFERSAARRIFELLTESGWAFDVEVLFLAQKLGYSIEEVAVNWFAVEGSKVRPRDAFRMLVSLFRIRRRHAGLTHT